MKLKLDIVKGVRFEGTIKSLSELSSNTESNQSSAEHVDKTGNTSPPQGKTCPKCGGHMTIQTVSESRKTGCGTILFYFFLAITILGLLVLIPLILRKKNETVAYAVCQNCGHKIQIKKKSILSDIFN